jgi:APA family basic amino acid/polyamine antiporter
MGLVIANMIGTGVLISAGFLVQDLSASMVLLAWVVGMALALCGALAYGGLARAVGRSGGEFRFLADILHPVLGCAAGWGSLFIGFSAPIAINAIAIGQFGATIDLQMDPKVLAVSSLLALVIMHSIKMRASRDGQNLLVGLKIVLVVGLVLVALGKGSWVWPTWSPPGAEAGGSLLDKFIGAQYWIAFAFSGWNAAIYCTEEFREPKRDVMRSMFLGCLVVGLLYLAVNWVFVANLTPADSTVVFAYDNSPEKLTLAHLVMTKLMGEGAGAVVSVLIMVALFSSMSAMMFVGPRVYAEMAKDGFLPEFFKGREGEPPAFSVVLQAVIALLLVFTQTLLTILQACAAVLMLFTALCCLANLLLPLMRKDLEAPSLLSRAGAAIYLVVVSWFLYKGIDMLEEKNNLLILAAVIAVLSVATFGMKKMRGDSAAS